MLLRASSPEKRKEETFYLRLLWNYWVSRHDGGNIPAWYRNRGSGAVRSCRGRFVRQNIQTVRITEVPSHPHQTCCGQGEKYQMQQAGSGREESLSSGHKDPKWCHCQRPPPPQSWINILDQIISWTTFLWKHSNRNEWEACLFESESSWKMWGDC